MAKKVKIKYERNKPHCNIGTIGHVDHGKTSLTAAITKVLSRKTPTKYVAYDDIDRDATERARGITINASHIEYETVLRHYTHIDCPGHQDYIKNMIIGTTQMDGVILVVALTDGPQEQTREHLILAKEIGIKYLVVYGNKLDAVLEKDMVEYIEVEILLLLESYGYIDITIVKGSATKALKEDYDTGDSEIGSQSIMKLMDVVDLIPQPKRSLNESFLMPIEESFTITGRGTVLTGKVEKGTIKVGDDIDIIGYKKYSTTCTGLEMYHKFLDFAEAGENVGVLVRSISRRDVKRGFVLAHPNTIVAGDKFLAKAYILTTEEGGRKKGFASNFKPQFFFRTSNVTGAIILTDVDDIVTPGDSVEFQVHLLEKVALNEGLRFTIREGTITIGAGFIVKVI